MTGFNGKNAVKSSLELTFFAKFYNCILEQFMGVLELLFRSNLLYKMYGNLLVAKSRLIPFIAWIFNIFTLRLEQRVRFYTWNEKSKEEQAFLLSLEWSPHRYPPSANTAIIPISFRSLLIFPLSLWQVEALPSKEGGVGASFSDSKKTWSSLFIHVPWLLQLAAVSSKVGSYAGCLVGRDLKEIFPAVNLFKRKKNIF